MRKQWMVGIGLGLAVLGMLAVAVTFFLLRSPAGETTEPPIGNPFDFSPDDGQPNAVGATRSIESAGGPVSVPDFTEGRSSMPLGEGEGNVQYDLTPYPEYEPGKPYPVHAFDVQFNERGSEFVVTLNTEPLGDARRAAENFLRTELDAEDTVLCSLSVLVGVPYSVNAAYSVYQNLGLSFCPNAVPLP